MGLSPQPPSTYQGSLTGPIVLITLGVIFLLHQIAPGWGIGKTWPILLIVVGVLKLLNSTEPPRAPRGPKV